MFPYRYLLPPERFRRILAGVLCVCILAANLPIPIVVSSASFKDRSIPFPCQDDACGCRSAQQCWTSCCCYSEQERLAWARSYDVDVPASVRSVADDRPSVPACCAGHKATCETPQPIERESEPTPIGYVLTSSVMKCGGQSASWGGLPWAVIAVAPVSTKSVDPAQFSRPVSDRLPSFAVVPPTPPPRLTNV